MRRPRPPLSFPFRGRWTGAQRRDGWGRARSVRVYRTDQPAPRRRLSPSVGPPLAARQLPREGGAERPYAPPAPPALLPLPGKVDRRAAPGRMGKGFAKPRRRLSPSVGPPLAARQLPREGGAERVHAPPAPPALLPLPGKVDRRAAPGRMGKGFAKPRRRLSPSVGPPLADRQLPREGGAERPYAPPAPPTLLPLPGKVDRRAAPGPWSGGFPPQSVRLWRTDSSPVKGEQSASMRRPRPPLSFPFRGRWAGAQRRDGWGKGSRSPGGGLPPQSVRLWRPDSSPVKGEQSASMRRPHPTLSFPFRGRRVSPLPDPSGALRRHRDPAPGGWPGRRHPARSGSHR